VVDSHALRERLASVRARIAQAAARTGRDSDSVRLVAISKTFPVDYVRVLADAGQVDFGENKVQEALQKMEHTSDLHLQWHLVGHLQPNKARKAAAHFDVIHSVDDADIVRRLDESAVASGRTLQLLVQADLAGEPTKHGAREDELEGIFRGARACRAAHLAGLMLLPPQVDDPEAARPYFRHLQEIRRRLLEAGVDAQMLNEMSMGMSHDFEVAIEEGATLVRVGTAIFGARPTAARPVEEAD
jgi:pyridoxal phosphate enzyme (YggS family)